jgi:MoxR-like ATPase
MRKPGIAELLDWLYELTRERNDLALALKDHPRALIAAKTTLLKHAEDQKKATAENWTIWLIKAGLQDEHTND